MQGKLHTKKCGYEILDFIGSFTTSKAAENNIRRTPVDIALIRIGKAALNAFALET
jgi:hypothetical protein